MPLFRITTAKDLAPEDREKLLLRASVTASQLLGKPEGYVMTQFLSVDGMSFAATLDPACFVEFKSLGLPPSRTGEFSEAICSFIGEELSIPKERVYIEFSSPEREMWGFNGTTFG